MKDIRWAKKFVVELSNRLGDESDYEEKLLPKFTRMIEILNHSFTCTMVEDLPTLVDQIKPNLPWANDHFEERVGGLPLNPPPSNEWWPFNRKKNQQFKNLKS